MKEVRVQREDFDVSHLLGQLEALGSGAVASFTGIVRGDDDVALLTLEHYPQMTERALGALADEAALKWPLGGVVLVHRVGDLPRGDRIVFVGTASAHRAAALEACSFLIDRLKTDVPLWKKETKVGGAASWVEERTTDIKAADKWR